MDAFWRKELWHPVTVHFPIALLLVATLCQTLSFILRGESKRISHIITFVLLTIGVTGVWISIYTGGLAEGIVARRICDPTILKDHEIAAQTTGYLFTSAFVISLFLFRLSSQKLKTIATLVVLVLSVAGSFFLIKTGHLGANVVYEQGGGVKNHPADCE